MQILIPHKQSANDPFLLCEICHKFIIFGQFLIENYIRYLLAALSQKEEMLPAQLEMSDCWEI